MNHPLPRQKQNPSQVPHDHEEKGLPASAGKRLRYWGPPILWMAAIYGLSTDHFSPQNTGSVLERILRSLFPPITTAQLELLHTVVRKSAHLTVYAILALFLLRAFRAGAESRWQTRWALSAGGIVAIYALLDELHQAFTRTRGASIYDSLLDMSGALIAIFIWWACQRSRKAH